jgi:ABC-type nitrate/sulfonate/bicarbonate transport system substrate-binding protein
LVLGIFILLVTVLIGRIRSKPQPLATPNTPTLTISIPPASAMFLINGVIIDQQLDRKYGYKLNLVLEQPQNYLTSLITDKSQIIPLAPSDFAELKKGGQDLRMFGVVLKMYCPFVTNNTFVVKPDDPLKGKKVAIVKRPSGPYSILDTLMSNKSVKLTNYFRVVEADLLSLPILLSRGDVDASNMCNIVSVAKLLSQNKYKIVDSSEAMIKREFPDIDGIPLFGLVSRNEWLTNNQALAKAYLMSRNDALEYLNNNLDQIIQASGSGNLELNPDESRTLEKLIRDNNYLSFPDWQKTIKDIQTFTKQDFDQSYFVSLP